MVHVFPGVLGAVLVELGCGSAAKTSILLNALLEREGPAGLRFAGIDVSSSALAMAKSSLLESCSGLLPGNIDLVCAEYIEGARHHLAAPHASRQLLASARH